MNSSQQKLIELATLPLTGKPEAQGEAASELTHRLGHSDHPQDTLSPALEELNARLEEAATRAEKKGGARSFSDRLALPGLLVLLAAVGVLGCLTWDTLGDFALLSPNPSPANTPEFFLEIREQRIAGLIATPPPFRAELVQEDPAAALAEAEALHRAHPDDPAFYQAYVSQYFRNEAALPPDLESTAAGLDPENAFWPCLIGSPVLSEPFRPLKPYHSTMMDVASHERAAALPHWIDYRRELAHRQRAAFRPALSRAESLFIQRSTSRSKDIQLYSRIGSGYLTTVAPLTPAASTAPAHARVGVTKTFSSSTPAAGSSSSTGPFVPAALRPIIGMETWLKLNALRLTQPGSAVPVLPENLAPGCGGQTEAEDAAVQKVTALQSKALLPYTPGAMPGELPDSGYTAYTLRLVLLVLSLALLLPAIAYTYLKPRMLPAAARGLAAGLLPAFSAGDHVRIFAWGAGVLLIGAWRAPSLANTLFFFVHHPQAIFSVGSLGSLSSVAGLFTLPLCLMLYLSAGSLERRLGPLRVAPGGRWLPLLMVILSAVVLVIPALLGWMIHRNPGMIPALRNSGVLLAISCLGLIPLMWLLWRFFTSLVQPRQTALPVILTARLMRPALIGMLALTLCGVEGARLWERSQVTAGAGFHLEDQAAPRGRSVDEVVEHFRKELSAP